MVGPQDKYLHIMNASCSLMTGWTAPNDPYPFVGFDGVTQPPYIPKGVIIPTLDDGPDGPDPIADDGGTDGYSPGSFTKTDLAFLDANNLHFDMFINSNNWTDQVTGDCATEPDPEPHNDILDILTLHNPGNHTVHHVAMATNSSPPVDTTATSPQCCDCMFNSNITCDSELAGIETLVNKMTNGGRPHLTRMRPPYGAPWPGSGYTGNLTDAQMAAAKYAVAVGWHIDDTDSNWNGPSSGTPPPTGDAIVQAIMGQISSGSYGILLMHAVFGWTADALPKLFGPGGQIPTSQLATVEDAICWKYGKHSWDLIPGRAKN
jgi:peptidoglycan/xylan/chitin deacetylase (PgdA/CDA1 family)